MGKGSMITTAAAIGLALALPPAGRGFAAGQGTFDGAWSVEIDCPAVGDVEAYNWRFPAQVSSGALSGHYRSPTNSAMGSLSGRIRPDGEAVVTVVGRTGPEQVARFHERRGAPFRYTADVHFDAHGGSGMRNELRACTLAFTKA
jgi:hypothetical protein